MVTRLIILLTMCSLTCTSQSYWPGVINQEKSSTRSGVVEAGIIMGEGLTTLQQKTNWTILSTLCENNLLVEIPNGVLEVYPTDSIDITDQTLHIKGEGQNQTTISIFPKYKNPSRGMVKLFNIGEKAVFELTDLTFTQYTDRYAYETYQCVANVDANVSKVRVDVPTRTDFFTSISVGDTLLFQLDSNTLGNLVTVASIDVAGSKITFNESTTASPNYTTLSTLVARPIPEGSLHANFSPYSKQWNSQNYDDTRLIYSNTVNDDFEDLSIINLNRVTVTELDQALSIIQSYIHTNINECRISAQAIGINWTGTFSNSTVDVDPKLIIENSTIYECGTIVQGSVSSSTVAANGVYGGGVYNSSTCPAKVINTKFINNRTTAYRNFGSGINTIPGRRLDFIGCLFIGNTADPDGKNLILSKAFDAKVENCSFYGSGLLVGHSTEFSNCQFESQIVANSNANPEVSDSIELHLKFNDCVFKVGSVINTDGWDSEDLQDSRLSIINSTFFNGSGFSSSCEYNTVKDCVLKASSFTPALGNYVFRVGGLKNRPSLLLIDNFSIEEGVVVNNFITSSQPYNVEKIIVRDSDLRGAEFLSGRPANIFVENTLYESVTPSYYRAGTITSLPKQRRFADIGSETFFDFGTGGNVTVSDVMLADYQHNYYVTSASELRNIQFVPDRYYDPSVSGAGSCNYIVDAEINIYAENNLNLIPYGIDPTNSNIVGADTIKVTAKETVTLHVYGSGSLGGGLNTGVTLINETLASATDNIANFATSSYERAEPIEPGSISVFVDGILVGKDDGRGNIVSGFSTVSGIKAIGGIHYHNDAHGIYFSPALTSGQVVLVTCNTISSPVQQGYVEVKR